MCAAPNTVDDGRFATRSSRSVLAGLLASIGSTGLAATAELPGLLAAVDQHAAAIRDSIAATGRRITPHTLAGYMEGVREGALAHGWLPPSGPVNWDRADWMLVRLLAVCALTGPDRH
jgi:hypothetical protein